MLPLSLRQISPSHPVLVIDSWAQYVDLTFISAKFHLVGSGPLFLAVKSL